MAVSKGTAGVHWVERHADGMTLALDVSLYPDEVVFRACYAFTDRCYMFLQRDDANAIRVNFRARRQGADLDAIVGQFSNELINQRLRYTLARETRPIRELIVSQAFAEAKFGDE